MTGEPDRSSRRGFVADVGRLASVAALTACANTRPAQLHVQFSSHAAGPSGKWDLSWVERLGSTTDRAVFDWPNITDPADPIVLEVADRYLDNCEAVYGPRKDGARVVLNIRSKAVPAALIDAAWERYALGVAYNIKDPVTQQPAIRNPFWSRSPGLSTAPAAAPSTDPPVPAPPTIGRLVQRGAIVLVCDFALGHLAKRVAAKSGTDPDAVHRELRGEFIPGAFAVPSGIFGLVRAQNAGCAYVGA